MVGVIAEWHRSQREHPRELRSLGWSGRRTSILGKKQTMCKGWITDNKPEAEWGERRQMEVEKGCGLLHSTPSHKMSLSSKNWSTTQGP